ncbi:MAG TPA: hypothetical protein VKZ79_09300 [Alphaproteobacteria bacterium]|nr:hypothetical protein [Alphaproteobacteria bacterium]
MARWLRRFCPLLDAVLGCFIAVVDSLLHAAVGDKRLMRRMRIVFLGVVCATIEGERMKIK